MRPAPRRETKFVVCVSNRGYPASLEPRKIYQVVRDPDGAPRGQIRVIDESGEDYLFPSALFRPILLSPALRRAVLAAA